MTAEPAYLNGLRQHIPQAAIEARGWTEQWAAPIGVVEAPHGFGEELWRLQQDQTLIAWTMRGSPVVSEMPGFVGKVTGPGTINLQLAGMPGRYRAEGALTFCHFYLNEKLVARVAEGLGRPDFSLASLRDDLIMPTDPGLHALLHTYARRSRDRVHPASRVELEARAMLIVDHLIVRHHTPARPTARGGLSPSQLKRACEAMTAQLDGNPGLDDLAAIVGCSATHFSRAFKQSTGLAPFRWLAERRIEWAKTLLEDKSLSLAEIALAVGFSAQPQFTTAFGRAAGMTPGQWRRERLS